jgi:hypothetical protein
MPLEAGVGWSGDGKRDGAGHVHRHHLPRTAVANDHPIDQPLHYIMRPMVTHTVCEWRGALTVA